MRKSNSGYDRVMEQVWSVKETIYRETKNMSRDEYWRYVARNIAAVSGAGRKAHLRTAGRKKPKAAKERAAVH